MIDRNALLAHLDRSCSPTCSKDYCPNGLQEGKVIRNHSVRGDASQALIEAAIAHPPMQSWFTTVVLALTMA